MNDASLFGENKCVHRCAVRGHIIEIHTKTEAECDRPDQQCAECDWQDSGIDAVRGYIR